MKNNYLILFQPDLCLKKGMIVIMKKKLLKIATSMLIILTMLFGNFALLFENAITYAADGTNGEVSTSHRNVEFSAVIQKVEGEEGAELKVGTDENDLKLHMQIAVKQEGYLEGTIELDTANFRLKTDILSEGITKIEGNTITLSQINAGETRDLLVGIEPIKDETFNLSLLNMESKISLRGIYRDSSEKDIKIEGIRTLKLELVSPYSKENTGNILKQQMITNKVITENGENKRVIQMEVETGIEGNLYPIKEDRIGIETPKIEDKNPEAVQVSTMEELVINGKKLEESNWEYNAEEGKVIIDIKNEAENNVVTWKKEGSNKIIVTYIYDTEAEIEKQEVEVNSEIDLYDNNNTKITGNYTLGMIQEERDNLVRLEVKNREDNIYKGKIQEGIEREITEEVGIEATAEGIAEKIEIEEDNSEINLQNVYARRTVINKEEIDSILGEAGSIIIYNADTSEIIKAITKNTEIDSSGNIVVTYPEDVSRIRIVVNNPEKAGKINLENVKVIKENDKEDVKDISNINYIINGKYYIGNQENDIESKKATINLLNTETSAKLEVNRTELSTMTENTGVEIRVVLKSNNEKYDLYENPTINIELPEAIQEINVNSINLLYAENEMRIVNPRLVGNTIQMTLEGKQQTYKDEAVEGPTIIINADLTLDRKAGNSAEKILLNYTNANATAYEGGSGTKEVDIAVKSYAGVITTAEIPEYELNIINNEGTKTAKLELGAESKTANVQSQIINNNGSAITNVRILGTYPTKEAIEGNNIDIAVSDIAVEGIDASRARIYYTENANATEDIENTSNGWTTEMGNASLVKKYMIVIDKLDVQEEMNFSYRITIPENLEYNYIAKQGYVINYADINGTEQKINLDQITLETGAGPVVDTTLKAFNGTQEVTEVPSGSYIRYQMTATNTGSEIVSNLSLVGQVPEGTIYVEDKTLPEDYEGNITDEVETGIIEYPDKETVEYTIETLSPGETVTREYMVKVEKDTGTINNNVTVKYGEVTKDSNTVSLNATSGKLNMNLTSINSGPIISEGYGYGYNVKVLNTAEETLRNVKVKVNTGDMDVSNSIVTVMDADENLVSEVDKTLDDNNEVTVDELQPNHSVSIKVTLLPKIADMSASTVDLYAEATVDNDTNTYYSNVKETTVKTILLSIDSSSENSGSYVKEGDQIKYSIVVKNSDQKDAGNMILQNELPANVTLVSISKDGVQLTENDYYLTNNLDNSATIINTNPTLLGAGQTATYEIVVNVDQDVDVDEATELVNKSSVYDSSIKIDESDVTHILQPTSNPTDNPEDPSNPNNPNNPNNPSNPENPGNAEQETRIISGTAWLDSNENGQKDENEELLSGITVRILNTETNELLKNSEGNDLIATTNNNGFYSLNNIPQGQYIVIFEYDTDMYMLTDYEKEGVDSRYTSKVVKQELTINGETKAVGGTEIINVSDNNIANINIGLQAAKVYDLKLDKYVSKIIMQNSSGTTTNEYDNTTLAKAEIDAKLINSTNVVVEYTIRVTNEGEVPAYVRRIVDYVSTEYTFSSELNPDWYEQDGRLYNVSLSNEKLDPGESTEVTLTLTKKMTETNTGLISNTAEIAESYNEQGIKDQDSTENNNATGEDDLGKADVILSIKTGQVVSTIGIVLASIVIIGLGAFVVIRILIKRGKI